MEKISLSAGNDYCPQPLFLYGTYNEDGTPDYGLFCWASYCYLDKMKFVASICEDKRTRDNIRREGVLSATVVADGLLPAADYCGTHPGYEYDKSAVIPTERGALLDIPVPKDGAWTLELKVDQTLHPDGWEDVDIYICSIVNVQADKRLCDETLSFEEKMALVKPVMTMCCKYIPVELKSLGDWGSFLQA